MYIEGVMGRRVTFTCDHHMRSQRDHIYLIYLKSNSTIVYYDAVVNLPSSIMEGTNTCREDVQHLSVKPLPKRQFSGSSLLSVTSKFIM